MIRLGECIMVKVLAMTCCCVDVYPELEKVTVGGNALNLAANCAKSGKVKAYLMGNIGTDAYANEIKKVVDSFGIQREHLYEVEGESANHIIHISESGDRYFKENSWTNGAYATFKITSVDEQFMKEMDGIATTVFEPEFQHILEIKRTSDFVLSVDFHDERARRDWETYFDAIDLFFISGVEEDLSILKEWSTRYQTVFVATLGAHGSIAYQAGKEYRCEAIPVETIVDTTGCGDSYQGAFLVEYLMSQNILKAMQAGSEAAAITLTFVGGIA